ncbi:MAG: hypothetical protein ACRCZ4_13425 [Plesiomonas sp.]|uniref:hypothetical protein n=1 Tax=Plesiomonas sp. TaxID=2486279 RepID=UPI003F2CAA34
MFAIPQSPPDELELPLFLSSATYGFPRPTQDYVEQTIDLNPRYIEHLAAIFYV